MTRLRLGGRANFSSSFLSNPRRQSEIFTESAIPTSPKAMHIMQSAAPARRLRWRPMLPFTVVAVLLGLTACVGPRGPLRRDVVSEPAYVPDTQVLFYPAAGQSPE